MDRQQGGSTNRRTFLTNLSTGFGGIALGSLLAREGLSADTTSSPPQFAPRAKNVIWLFMIGGTSHVESFDPKPALNRYAGKSIGDTPYKNVLKSPFLENERDFFDNFERKRRTTIFPMQVNFIPGDTATTASFQQLALGSVMDWEHSTATCPSSSSSDDLRPIVAAAERPIGPITWVRNTTAFHSASIRQTPRPISLPSRAFSWRNNKANSVCCSN